MSNNTHLYESILPGKSSMIRCHRKSKLFPLREIPNNIYVRKTSMTGYSLIYLFHMHTTLLCLPSAIPMHNYLVDFTGFFIFGLIELI